MFWIKNKKNRYTPANSRFLFNIKVGHVFLMAIITIILAFHCFMADDPDGLQVYKLRICREHSGFYIRHYFKPEHNLFHVIQSTMTINSNFYTRGRDEEVSGAT